MARPKSINICWQKPILWDDHWRESPYVQYGPGVYAFTRVFGEKETLLYIGETKRSFRERMEEHIEDHKKGKEEFLFCRGRIYLRCGIIENLNGYTDLELKRILRNVETHLIWEYNPKYNRKQLQTSQIWKRLRIWSTGSSWKFKRYPILNTDRMEGELCHE